MLTDLIAKLGENIVIKRFIKLSNKTEKYQKYLHNSINENSGKIGVLLLMSVMKIMKKYLTYQKIYVCK